MLRFLERSFVWPGLDQIEASGEAEPLMRKVLQTVMCSPEMAGRTERRSTSASPPWAACAYRCATPLYWRASPTTSTT